MTSKVIRFSKYSYDDLQALAYQYTFLMLDEPRLRSRIPFPRLGGKFRVLIHLFKIFLGTVRYGRNGKRVGAYSAEKICFTASVNQQLCASEILKGVDSVLMVHFPGAKTQVHQGPLMVLKLSDFLGYCSGLFVWFLRHRIEIEGILLKNSRCLDYLCDIFFVEFFMEKNEVDANTIYICTDLSAFGNAIGKFFLDKGRTVVYLPHSPLLFINSPVFYDAVICRSKDEMEQRREWLADRNIDGVRFILREKAISKGGGIGILVKPEDNLLEVEEFVKKIDGEIYLRPHPMMSKPRGCLDLSERLDLVFSDPLLESADQFLSKVHVVVGQLSGMHKEILDLGGLAYVVSSAQMKDNYNVGQHENTRSFANWRDAAQVSVWSEK